MKIEMLSEGCKAAMKTIDASSAVANYLVVLFDQGDWMNDYLADVPACGRPLVEMAGQLISLALGF